MSFVIGGNEYYRDTPPPAAPPPPPRPPVQTIVTVQPPAPQPAAKPARKAFAMPKLKPASGFTSFRSPSGGNAAPPQAQGQNPQSQAQLAAAMAAAAKEKEKRYGKSASGAGSGSNLPQLGAFGSQQTPSQQQGAATPDINQLLKNLPADVNPR